MAIEASTAAVFLGAHAVLLGLYALRSVLGRVLNV